MPKGFLFFCRLTESFPLAALGRAKDTHNNKKKNRNFQKRTFLASNFGITTSMPFNTKNYWK